MRLFWGITSPENHKNQQITHFMKEEYRLIEVDELEETSEDDLEFSLDPKEDKEEEEESEEL